MTSQELGSLMGQTFQSLPFFRSFPSLPNNQSLQLAPLSTQENTNLND